MSGEVTYTAAANRTLWINQWADEVQTKLKNPTKKAVEEAVIDTLPLIQSVEKILCALVVIVDEKAREQLNVILQGTKNTFEIIQAELFAKVSSVNSTHLKVEEEIPEDLSALQARAGIIYNKLIDIEEKTFGEDPETTLGTLAPLTKEIVEIRQLSKDERINRTLNDAETKISTIKFMVNIAQEVVVIPDTSVKTSSTHIIIQDYSPLLTEHKPSENSPVNAASFVSTEETAAFVTTRTPIDADVTSPHYNTAATQTSARLNAANTGQLDKETETAVKQLGAEFEKYAKEMGEELETEFDQSVKPFAQELEEVDKERKTELKKHVKEMVTETANQLLIRQPLMLNLLAEAQMLDKAACLFAQNEGKATLFALAILIDLQNEKCLFAMSGNELKSIGDRPPFHLLHIQNKESPEKVNRKDLAYSSLAMKNPEKSTPEERTRAIQRTLIEVAFADMENAIADKDVVKKHLDLLEGLKLDKKDLPKDRNNIGHYLYERLYFHYLTACKDDKSLVHPHDPAFKGDFGRIAFRDEGDVLIPAQFKLDVIRQVRDELKTIWVE